MFGLDFASGFVLPLQGFWNTLIYIVTSLPACAALGKDIKASLFGARAPVPNKRPLSLTFSKHHHRALGSDDVRADPEICIENKPSVVYQTLNDSQDDGIAQELMLPDPCHTHASRQEEAGLMRV